MSRMKTARPNNNKIAIVGRGALALAAARELRAAGAEIAVMPEICGLVPPYLGIIEATGGLAPAFDCAMTALGKGLPLISTSPLLAGVHGKMLAATASAQGLGLGLSGALLGAVPVPTQGDEMVLLSGGAAAQTLERLSDRGQKVLATLANLSARHDDTSDAGGKITLCRALALHGLWSGRGWLAPGGAKRVEVEALSAERAAEIRRAGYVWRFGALIQPAQVYVGPLAIGAGEALAQRPVNGLVLQAGALTLEVTQPEAERALQGMLHDVSLLRQNQLHPPLRSASRAEVAGSVSDWLPLNDEVSVPALGRAASTALRLAA